MCCLCVLCVLCVCVFVNGFMKLISLLCVCVCAVHETDFPALCVYVLLLKNLIFMHTNAERCKYPEKYDTSTPIFFLMRSTTVSLRNCITHALCKSFHRLPLVLSLSFTLSLSPLAVCSSPPIPPSLPPSLAGSWAGTGRGDRLMA